MKRHFQVLNSLCQIYIKNENSNYEVLNYVAGLLKQLLISIALDKSIVSRIFGPRRTAQDSP